MNYILEIIAFEQWLETHYLPISPQLLWYKILYLCNRSGWSEWVTVDNLRLMAAMQMGREATLIKARDELIKAGLIEYQKGKKGSPNRYHLIALSNRNTFKSEVQSEAKYRNTFKSEVQSEVYPVVESEVQSGVYPVVESADIYKQNKTKQKSIPPIPPVQHFEDFWAVYPNKRRRQLAEKAYCDLILDGNVSEDELVEAAGKYAKSCLESGMEEKYVKYACNFLQEYIFKDYLEPNKADLQRELKPEMEEELVGEDAEWWRYGPNAWED